MCIFHYNSTELRDRFTEFYMHKITYSSPVSNSHRPYGCKLHMQGRTQKFRKRGCIDSVLISVHPLIPSACIHTIFSLIYGDNLVATLFIVCNRIIIITLHLYMLFQYWSYLQYVMIKCANIHTEACNFLHYTSTMTVKIMSMETPDTRIINYHSLPLT